jgi:hypothetical protein
MSSMPVETVPFSELLRAPNETTERLIHSRGVRLRRRDASDVMLVSVERAEQEGELVDLTARLLANLLRRDPSLVREVLPTVLPWTMFLPDGDVDQLATEFVAVAEAAAAISNWAPVSQLLTAWRHTAEIHADPELHAALTRQILGDFGPVPMPDGA